MMRGVHTIKWLLLGPVRVLMRILLAAAWIVGCWVSSIVSAALKPLTPGAAQSAQKAVSRFWINGLLRIVGIRIRTQGEPPEAPYFLVVNHITWVDYFVMNSLLDAVCVLQAEDERIPLLGRLMKALNPVFTERKCEDIPRTVSLMVKRIREGCNLLMAPEGIVSPGKVVRRFRPALLESAALTRKPVHYASITCRTPEGYPAASQVTLFGPDPYYRTPDGRIPDAELEAWGPERSFLWHLLLLLSLPWHEFTVHFAPKPVEACERHALARNLQQAVSEIFIPVP